MVFLTLAISAVNIYLDVIFSYVIFEAPSKSLLCLYNVIIRYLDLFSPSSFEAFSWFMNQVKGLYVPFPFILCELWLALVKIVEIL